MLIFKQINIVKLSSCFVHLAFIFWTSAKNQIQMEIRFKFFRSHQKHSLARARTMIERGRTEYLKVELDFVAKPAEFLFLWSLSLSFWKLDETNKNYLFLS